MWFKKKDKHEQTHTPPDHSHYPQMDYKLEQIKQAVREYEKHLPQGVKRSVLVQQDNRIDSAHLVPYLKGVPTRSYYMSKHTYEIFEEDEKLVPFYLDIVQQAVDDYISAERKFPIIEDDPDHKINYDVLIEQGYIKEKPPLAFYLTREENMITHRKPR